jgi:hypothetical protein
MNSARQDALSARRMMTSGMDSSAKAADPMQDAVYNRVLMAAMAGRRTMVVTDYTGGNGSVAGRRMADYMNSSGGVALTATGYRGARLEDLLSEAAVGIGLKRSNDLEELALSLERSLDAAGSGLLVIFDAHLLSAPVIGDLCELSGSDTESGLYMQVLLTGGPGLDAQFEKPGLANAARLVASSRWRIESDDQEAAEEPASPPVVERQAPVPLAAPARAAQPARSPALPKTEQSAFTRPRAERQQEFPASGPVPEQRPLRRPRAVHAYDIQSDPRPEHREPAKSSNRVYWVLAIGILFAFAAGFVTNALWPFAPKSATELLEGDGLSALTANLPSAPSLTSPSQPVERQEPAGPAPVPEGSAPAPQQAPQVSGSPATPPAAAGSTGAALPPDWKQPPVERQPPAATRSLPAPGSAPPAERPVMAAPTPLTPQTQQQAQVPSSQLPPRQQQVPPQPARAENPSDVCREGSGAAKPPQNSFAGIAEGFMTDLRNLGRCINSLAK